MEKWSGIKSWTWSGLWRYFQSSVSHSSLLLRIQLITFKKYCPLVLRYWVLTALNFIMISRMQALLYSLLGFIAVQCSQSYMALPGSYHLRMQGPSKLFQAYSSQRDSAAETELARRDESRRLKSCCDEDFCFPEPPSTEAGNSNDRYLLSKMIFYASTIFSWMKSDSTANFSSKSMLNVFHFLKVWRFDVYWRRTG